jgi:hypothetical protein
MSEPDVTSLMNLGQVVLTVVILVFFYFATSRGRKP